MVQPCDRRRRPTGPPVRVGPIRTDADIRVLQSWIEAARFDPALLPGHLVALHHARRHAAEN